MTNAAKGAKGEKREKMTKRGEVAIVAKLEGHKQLRRRIQ